MQEVVLVIHLILALAIIGLVLLQRSEGGGLGIGGGTGGLGGFATAHGTANALTKLTVICAILFFATSLTLGILANQKSSADKIFETIDNKVSVEKTVESVKDEEVVKEAPKKEEVPVAPISK